MAPPKDPNENTGGALPINQIYAACVAAGFGAGQDAMVMTAICMAESGGRPLAVGYAVPSRPDYGLAQINYIHKDDGGAIPADFFPPGQKWKIPITNLRAAKQIKDERGNFTPWVVFQTGAYSKYLKDAQAASGSGESYNGAIEPGPEFNGENATETIVGGAIPDIVGSMFSGLGKALWIGGGAVLVVLGFVMMNADKLPVGKIASVVKGMK